MIDKTLIPVSKVVAAALVDTYGDIGKTEHRFSFLATREAKKILRQSFNSGVRFGTLLVNKNTNTATLPLDVNKLLFVGYIRNGKKIPIRQRLDLVGEIEDIPCVDACPKCNQSKSICEDLTVTESEEIVTINGSNYVEVTVKRFYENGNYYLEKTIPYLNTVTDSVEYTTTKKFITALDLKDCGCLETSLENINKVEAFCPDVYGRYYTDCGTCNTNAGGYTLLEELGLIQLQRSFPNERVYIEYSGFLPKTNGQICVPEVAFEVIVEGTKLRAIKDKMNIPAVRIQMQHQFYKDARSAMDKEMGAISIDLIIQAFSTIPKFDMPWYETYDCGVAPVASIIKSEASCKSTALSSPINTSGGGFSGMYLAPFAFNVIVGNGSGTPIQGSNSWTSAQLVGALNMEFILVDNNTESKAKGQFTFDPVTGTINRFNSFQTNEVVIFNFAKYIPI